ncbi:MAG: thymidine phosphorylase [Pseudomonadota bacterium]
MDARGILAKLRDGTAPDPDELAWVARALAEGEMDAAQAGAFAMGICRTKLPIKARAALTLAMRDSGQVLRWDLPGPVMDKHSTGGIGDPISLMLGPAIAALGGYMPMLSGRGLGHSGGTLDKLEAIPGLSTELSVEAFQRVVAETGCAIVAASDQIAPADRALYAVRDVTSTVESIDLITASILSKKLAGGVGPLILDVKVGRGAFMSTEAEAHALADALVRTANQAAGPAAALITDMNQPAVPAIGNALEVMEVMRILTDPDLGTASTLVIALGGALLQVAGLVEGAEAGQAQVSDALASGDAAERFGRMVAAMGGPTDFVERWADRLPAAPVVRAVEAPQAGHVAGMDGRALGMAVVHLGGGRQLATDRVDPAVGLSDVVRIGDPVGAGDPLAIVHGSDAAQVEAMAEDLTRAFDISSEPVTPPDLIKEHVL